MKRTIERVLVVGACVFVGSSAIGCGGDDSSTGGSGASGGAGGSAGNTSSGGSSGKAGAGGTAGTAGAAGSGGASGGRPDSGPSDSGTTDTGGPVTLPCGTKMCASIEAPGVGTLPACCPMGEMNACGLVIQSICFTTTPGTNDPSCLPLTVQTTMGPMTVPGCCTALGVCGGNLGAPVGCNDLSPFTGMSPVACAGDAGMPPPPQDSGADSTTPSDAALDHDADGQPGDAGSSDVSSDRPSSDGQMTDGRSDSAG